MTTSEKLKRYRETHGYSIKKMSGLSGVSETLLKMVENGMVTHPYIAKRIAMAYELDEYDAYELMPEIHRPGNPKYNPNKYKQPEGVYKSSVVYRKSKKERDADAYFAERKRRKWRAEEP